MNLRKIALQAFADIVDHDAYANLRAQAIAGLCFRTRYKLDYRVGQMHAFYDRIKNKEPFDICYSV